MMLQREGVHINHKKVYRLYKKAGLALKRKLKRKIYVKRRTPDRSHLLGPNDRWSMDFVSDITATGRRFRIFALNDEVTRKCIALEVNTSINGQHVTRYLNKAMPAAGRKKFFLTTVSNLPAMPSMHGPVRSIQSMCLSIPGTPCIMVSLKASMGSSGMNVLT